MNGRVADVVRVSCGVKGVDPAPPCGGRMASGKAVVTGRATNPLRVSSHLRYLAEVDADVWIAHTRLRPAQMF